MKTPNFFLWILSGCLLFTGCRTYSSSEVFPGVTLYDYPARLDGRLALLLAIPDSTPTAAVICTIDLNSRDVREVARAPIHGGFNVSEDGSVFCVIDDEADLPEPKAFLYADRVQTQQLIALPQRAKVSALLGEYAFFLVNGAQDSGIWWYEVATGRHDFLRVTGTNVWEYENFQDLWIAEDVANSVRFRYSAWRNPRRKAGNSVSGVFTYNLFSGEILQMPWTTVRSYDYMAKNGRFVFFEGTDAPVSGRKLVSSPVSDSDIGESDMSTRRSVKLLKRFPRLASGDYWLVQLSPDKQYAFVQKSVCLKKPEGVWIYTYYAVDTTTGEAWPLLKDESRLKTRRQMYPWVYWISKR